MTQQLRALTILAEEDLSSISSAHIVVHTSITPDPGDQMPSLGLHGYQVYT